MNRNDTLSIFKVFDFEQHKYCYMNVKLLKIHFDNN